MARTTKTPAQIREELEAKLARAQQNEAKALASDNPLMAKLNEAINSYSKDINILSRELNGPDSYSNRRKAFQLRLAAVDAGEALANALDADYRAAKAYLQGESAKVVELIANGGEFTDAMLADILDGVPTSDRSALVEASNNADAAWRKFGEDRRKPAKAAEVTNTTGS